MPTYYPNINAGAQLVQPAANPPSGGSFSVSSAFSVSFVRDKRDANGNKIPGQTETISGTVDQGYLPGLNPTTGQFDLNDPELVAGIEYTMAASPAPVTFLVQGLLYPSGQFNHNNVPSLAPTYNGNGSALPSGISVTYTYEIRDSKGIVRETGSSSSGYAISGSHAAFHVGNLRALAQQHSDALPLAVTVNYSFNDGTGTTTAKVKAQVYAAEDFASLGGKLAGPIAVANGSTWRMREPNGATAQPESYDLRPPAVIIVDDL
jgi:hypothetical protein